MRRGGTSSGAGEGDAFGRVEKPREARRTTITAESAGFEFCEQKKRRREPRPRVYCTTPTRDAFKG